MGRPINRMQKIGERGGHDIMGGSHGAIFIRRNPENVKPDKRKAIRDLGKLMPLSEVNQRK